MKTKGIKNLFSSTDFDIVEFNNEVHPRIKIRPMYFELGFSPSSRIFGRRAVLDRVLQALGHLPSEYGFLIWDIYRPREVQEKLFNWMRDEIRKRSPQLGDQENYEETTKYAAPPSKVGEKDCAPHLSGGAIDLTLYEITSGRELEMGTVFDDCTERAHSHYFDRKFPLTSEENEIKVNRRLLLDVMENTGFVSYQYEWWHFDIGNRSWSRSTGNSAVFGPLFGDAEWPAGL